MCPCLIFSIMAMNPQVASSLISVGGSLFSGLGNFIGGGTAYARAKRLQRQQFELADNAAENAFQRQRQLAAEQNAYNDPIASRARLENAGFNPFLTNLDGSGQQLQQGSAPMAAVPDAPYQAASFGSNLGNDISSAFQGIMNAINSSKTANADAKLKEEQARREEMRNDAKTPDGKPLVLADLINEWNQSKQAEQTANSLAIQNRKSEMEMTFLSSTYHDEQGNTVPAAETGDGLSDADGNYTNYGFFQKNNMMKQVKELDNIIARNAEEWSKVDVNNKSVDYMNKQMDKIEEEIKSIKGLRPYQIMQLVASTRKLYSDILVNQTQAAKNQADTGLAIAQTATEGYKQSNISADTNQKKAQTETENRMRPWKVGSASRDFQSKGLDNTLKYWENYYNNESPWGNFTNFWLRPVGSSVVGAAIGALK